MKILVLSYLYPNVVHPHYGVFVHNRIKAIGRQCHVRVVNPIPVFPGSRFTKRYGIARQIPETFRMDGVTVYHPRYFTIPGMVKSLESFTYPHSVLKLIDRIYKDFPFDLVDLHWTYPDLPAGREIKKRYGKKMLVTLRGKEAFYRGQGRLREQIINRSLSEADAVISLSSELQEMAIQTGVDEALCHVVKNGVDTAMFTKGSQKKSRAGLGLADGYFNILTIGTLNYRKGFDRVIKALPDLLKMNRKIKYYIIGTEGPDGNYMAELKQLIKEHHLEETIVFVGKVPNDQLHKWYNAADLYCLPSRGEGCPNVLMESLACGCPVVACDVGSVRDIVDTDTMGVVTLNQFESFRSGLLNAFARDFERDGISTSMAGHTWDSCADKVCSIYNGLMDRK